MRNSCKKDIIVNLVIFLIYKKSLFNIVYVFYLIYSVFCNLLLKILVFLRFDYFYRLVVVFYYSLFME